MKAVVMYPGADRPEIKEIAKPTGGSEHRILLEVRAAAIKNLDISKAKGQHYSSQQNPEGQIIGTDGVGVSAEGKRFYGFSKEGMLAEFSLIDENLAVPVPDGLDDASAAAIPNAVMGSAMALLFRAKLMAGETVLINGATGVTGRMAIQVARHYGAGKIIVTGRNEAAWPELQRLGADRWITLAEDTESLGTIVKSIHAESPIDIVLDYLWGVSAEAILMALKGDGGFASPVRYITIGGMTGDRISLSSAILRSTPVALMGSGLGSWSREEVGQFIQQIVPAFFQLAAQRQLRIETRVFNLSQLQEMWTSKLPGGVRAVVFMNE